MPVCRMKALLTSSTLQPSEYQEVQSACCTTLACTLHAMPAAARKHAIRRLAQNLPESSEDAQHACQAVATGDRDQLYKSAAALLHALCNTRQQAWRRHSVATGGGDVRAPELPFVATGVQSGVQGNKDLEGGGVLGGLSTGVGGNTF